MPCTTSCDHYLTTPTNHWIGVLEGLGFKLRAQNVRSCSSNVGEGGIQQESDDTHAPSKPRWTDSSRLCTVGTRNAPNCGVPHLIQPPTPVKNSVHLIWSCDHLIWLCDHLLEGAVCIL